MHGARLYTHVLPVVNGLVEIRVVAECIAQRAGTARKGKLTLACDGIDIALKLSHVVGIATMVAAYHLGQSGQGQNGQNEFRILSFAHYI